MTTELVQYSLQDGIATIRIDDGKRNALSPQVFSELNAAFDRAERDRAVVILTGREDVFSAGFDLKVMKRGGSNTLKMLGAGYLFTARILGYPYPVIAASPGHVFAMGVFMMLSADYTIGSRGDYKISANEVAIGMTMPRVAAATLRNRLKPAAYQRAVALSEYFTVDSACDAGFFDEVVETEQLMDRAHSLAHELKKLDDHAHKVSKRRIRRALIWKIRACVPLDLLDAAWLGYKRSRA